MLCLHFLNSRCQGRGPLVAMDSGANSFIFTADFAVPGSIVPSTHCLISATSGPAQIPLEQGIVVFGMYDSCSELHVFRQTAFLHSDLPLALFPVSLLADSGSYFDFYSKVGLTWGSFFFPFTRQNGLYLAPIVHLSHDSPDILDFGQVPSSDALSIAFPVLTRSMQGSMAGSSSDLLLDAPAPVIPIVLPLPVPADSLGIDCRPANLNMTRAGALLFAAHRRYGHPHDRRLKRMIESGLCGNARFSYSCRLLGLSKGTAETQSSGARSYLGGFVSTLLPSYGLGLVWSSRCVWFEW